MSNLSRFGYTCNNLYLLMYNLDYGFGNMGRGYGDMGRGRYNNRGRGNWNDYGRGGNIGYNMGARYRPGMFENII